MKRTNFTQNQAEILRYLNFLYSGEKQRFSLTKEASNFNFKNVGAVNKFIVEKKLLTNVGNKINPIYVWSTTKPTIKTAISIELLAKKYMAENSALNKAKRYKSKNKIQTKLQLEENLTKDSVKTEEYKKVHNVIKEKGTILTDYDIDDKLYLSLVDSIKVYNKSRNTITSRLKDLESSNKFLFNGKKIVLRKSMPSKNKKIYILRDYLDSEFTKKVNELPVKTQDVKHIKKEISILWGLFKMKY